LSAAFTAHTEHLSGRTDLTVTCAPGAGHGAPGCFIPALATIELDGTHLGHDPATCHPDRLSDRDRYPALWGVFIHENSHAGHSVWTTPKTAAGTAGAEAAELLEESRIEAVHLRGRPADRRWLRACVQQLILTDFTSPPTHAPTSGSTTPTPVPSTAPSATPGPAASGAAASGAAASGAARSAEPTPEPGMRSTAPAVPHAAMTPWDAARAAALLLARVDAGVLDSDETSTLAEIITRILGSDKVAALSIVWKVAHATADNDGERMLALGRFWCRIIGVDPDQPPPAPKPGEESSAGPSPLAAAITSTLGAVASADAPPPPPVDPDKKTRRRKEKAAHKRARDAAARVFTPNPYPDADSGRVGDTRITGTRPPTTAEQAAARKLARHLRAAAHRERTAIYTTSATPPGRLRMREALAAEAQRAAGAVPTAQPFQRTIHRHVPSPPLRVAIACDVSGSMYELAGPVASAAWIMARAVSHIGDARSATVIFGAHVRPVTHPGQVPAKVCEFDAADGTERFTEAIDALEAAAELTRPGAARLLVIVSDGHFLPDQCTRGQQRIDGLTATGCGVLWLGLDHRTDPMTGAHLLTLDDPAEAANTIGKAAAHALRHT
jgi:hypothetical protein